MKQYQSILNALEEKKVPIKGYRYDEQVMGSWFIETATTPTYRIVHDGRDETIVLEILQNEWKPLFADKTKSGKHVILKLINELERS